MAVVPVTSPLDRVANRPVAPGYQSDAGATPQAFGAGDGQTLAAAGQGAMKLGDAGLAIATDIQQEDNTRALKQADVTLADKTRTLLYGDGTAQNPGYFSKRGDDAVNAAPSTMAALQQAHNDVMGGLTNNHVRDIFSTLGQQRIVSAQQSVGGFIDQQRLVANVGASEARQASTINDAAFAYNDPKQLATSQSTVYSEAVAQGKLLGWSPDEVKAKADAETAKLFANVVKAAGRSGDWQTAQKILDDNRDAIPGTALAGIERELRTDQRNARIDAQLADAQAAKAEVKREQAAGNKLFSSIIQPDGTISVPSDFAAQVKAAGLKWETAHALINSAETMAVKGDKLTSDPTVMSALIRGAVVPEGEPGHASQKDVYEAVAARRLTTADAGFALGAMKPENLGDTQITKNALEGAMTTMVPGYLPGAPTQAGDAIQGRLYPYVYKALQDGKAEGKSTNSMLTPGSKDYILGPDVLKHIAKPQGDDVTGPSVFSAALASALNYMKSFQAPAAAKADPLDAPTTGALAPKQPAAAPGKPAKGRPSLDDIFGGK